MPGHSRVVTAASRPLTQNVEASEFVSKDLNKSFYNNTKNKLKDSFLNVNDTYKLVPFKELDFKPFDSKGVCNTVLNIINAGPMSSLDLTSSNVEYYNYTRIDGTSIHVYFIFKKLSTDKCYIFRYNNVSHKCFYIDSFIEFVNDTNIIRTFTKFNYSVYYTLSYDFLYVHKLVQSSTSIIKSDNTETKDLLQSSKKKIVFSKRLSNTLSIGSLDLETCNIKFDVSNVNVTIRSIYDYIKNDHLRYDYKIISMNLIIDLLKDMLLNHSGTTFFVHNLSKFDSLYIIPAVCYYNNSRSLDKDKIKLKLKNNKTGLINIELIFIINDKVHKIYLNDSYLLLPSSLDKLAKTYDLPMSKGIFPYTFINDNLFYKGVVPPIKEFNGLSIKDYKDFKKSFNGVYCIKTELINYLTKDIILLLYIIERFRLLIFFNYEIDIVKMYTVSKLALTVYNKISPDKIDYIPIIKSPKIYNYLKDAFYGGIHKY